jgi:hypothetical protein
VEYATYLGSTSAEKAHAAAATPDGGVVIGGYTLSPGFPFTAGGPIVPVMPSFPSYSQPFVAKFNPAATGAPSLVFSHFLGGTAGDGGGTIWCVDTDAAGNIYAAGVSSTKTLPIVNGFAGFPGDFNNAFLVKLSPDGKQILYSTYVGGSANVDEIRDIEAHDNGMVTVGGRTASANFPIKGGFANFNPTGNFDAFAMQIDTNASGPSSLVYSTVFGGAGSEWGSSVSVSQGLIYLAGSTQSYGIGAIPTTPNAFSSSNSGGDDVFLAVLDPSFGGPGSLVYATYLGGQYVEYPPRVQADADGIAYVAGATTSPGFPTTAGAFDTTLDVTFGPGTRSDATLSRINPFAATSAASLEWSTFFGGQQNDEVYDLEVDAQGRPTLVGITSSNNIPLSVCSPAKDSSVSALIVRFETTGALNFSRTYGGNQVEFGAGLALLPGGELAITGNTVSTNLPLAGAFQSTLASPAADDVYVAVMTACPEPPVGNDDLYVVSENGTLTVAAPGVLSNDTDPANGALTAALLTTTSHGDLTLAASGALEYTPQPGFVGFDFFSYTVIGPTGLEDTAIGIIEVTPAPPAVCLPCPAGQIQEFAWPLCTCVPCGSGQLASLEIPGLVPAFTPGTTQYTIPWPSDDSSWVIATTCDPTETIYIQGSQVASGQFFNAWAGGGTISISVYDGWTQVGSYTVTLDPNLPPAPLTQGVSSLTAPGMAPAFDPSVTAYTAPAPAGGFLTVTANTTDPSYMLYINSTAATPGVPFNAWAPAGSEVDVVVYINWVEIGHYTISIQ